MMRAVQKKRPSAAPPLKRVPPKPLCRPLRPQPQPQPLPPLQQHLFQRKRLRQRLLLLRLRPRFPLQSQPRPLFSQPLTGPLSRCAQPQPVRPSRAVMIGRRPRPIAMMRRVRPQPVRARRAMDKGLPLTGPPRLHGLARRFVILP